MDRPDWNFTWATVVRTMAERATCPRAKAGAALVTFDNQLLTTGYNGAPRRLPHCLEVGCELEGGHCVRALHAEANALLQAARLGIKVEGSICYSTHRPCLRCTCQLSQAGVIAVRYLEAYNSDDLALAEGWARKAGMGWLQL